MADRARFLRRKNFFVAAIITALFWLSWITIFFFVPPEKFFMPVLFVFVTFLAILFTGALLFANTRRGVLLATATVIFMLLRYFEIGNYLNLILLAGIFLSIEYYLSQKISVRS